MARTNATQKELAPENPQPEMNPWDAVMSNPRAAAAILNFGIAAMQPPSFGDNFGSQLGRAVGSGAEAVGRQEEMDRRQQEADSKAQLREMQANLAGERARTAGVGLGLQAERLRNADLNREALNQRALSLNQIRLTNNYYQLKQKHDSMEAMKERKAAEQAMYGQGQPYTPKPFMDFNSYASSVGVDPSSFNLNVPTASGASAGAPSAPAAAAGADQVYTDGKGNRIRWDPTSNAWVKV